MEQNQQHLTFNPPQGLRLFALFNAAIMGLLVVMALMTYAQKGILFGLIMAPVFLVMGGIWVWIFYIWGYTLVFGKDTLTLRLMGKETNIRYQDIQSVQRRGGHVDVLTKDKKYRLHYPNMKTLTTVYKALQKRIPPNRRNKD